MNRVVNALKAPTARNGVSAGVLAGELERRRLVAPRFTWRDTTQTRSRDGCTTLISHGGCLRIFRKVPLNHAKVFRRSSAGSVFARLDNNGRTFRLLMPHGLEVYRLSAGEGEGGGSLVMPQK